MLSHLTPNDDPRLVVDATTGDDAAVWRLDDDRALIVTADFITPLVDDAYTWGRIAAANAVSDVYAMGGTPISADQLTAQLLKAVVAVAVKQQGGEPDHITITHPANWGGYKLELLEQSIRAAGLDGVTTLTEPEAAVLHYSQQERVSTGSIIER